MGLPLFRQPCIVRRDDRTGMVRTINTSLRSGGASAPPVSVAGPRSTHHSPRRHPAPPARRDQGHPRQLVPSHLLSAATERSRACAQHRQDGDRQRSTNTRARGWFFRVSSGLHVLHAVNPIASPASQSARPPPGCPRWRSAASLPWTGPAPSGPGSRGRWAAHASGGGSEQHI